MGSEIPPLFFQNSPFAYLGGTSHWNVRATPSPGMHCYYEYTVTVQLKARECHRVVTAPTANT